MKEKALNLLGLMRKANAVQIGEENTGASVRAGTSKLLLWHPMHRIMPSGGQRALSTAETYRL